MTKQVIDIGIQGNDGTGDSIRDSFRKVNDNFNEIYAVFGIGGTINFENLSDGTTYAANQVIMGSTSGATLTARSLVAGAGITIDTSNNSSVTINSSVAGLVGDSAPTLSAPMNANGLGIGRVPDPSDELVIAFNLAHSQFGVSTTINQLAISKGYADRSYIKLSATGVVDGALRVRDQPSAPQFSDPDYDVTLSSNYVATEAMQRKDTVYRGGDKMTGPLTLSDHPSPLTGYGTPNGSSDLQAATKFYVDNSTFTSAVNLYVSTSSGDDLQQKSPVGKEGRYWQYAYKSIGAAALAAENLQAVASSEPGPYRQRIGFTVGPDQTFSTIQSVTLTGGNSADARYQDAYSLLLSNKAFIQAETIAYLNKKYVNQFDYDKAKCQRDVGYILDAVGYDLVLDSTFNTTRAASLYFDAASSTVLVAQLIQTIDAMKFVRDSILNFSYNSANLETYIGKVVNAICYDLVFQSNYQTVQAALAFSRAGTNLSASQMAEVLVSLRDTLIGVKSITGIVSARQILTISGTTGSDYITVNSSLGVVTGMPVEGTGIGAGAVVVSVVGDRINLSATNVGTVSGNGVFGANSITVDDPTNIVVGQTVTGNGIPAYSVVTRIEGNIVLINQSTSGIVNGLGTFVVLTDISNLSSAYTSVVDNIANMISIIEFGTMPTINFPTAAGADVGYENARDLLLNNITFIQAEAIAYIGAQYPNLSYDKATCKRDVEYIVWSLIYDAIYQGNSQSVYAGQMYWNNAVRQIASTEVAPILDVLTYINTLTQHIVDNTSPTTVYQQSIRQYTNETLANGAIIDSSLSANIAIIKAIITDYASTPTIVQPDVTAGATALQTIRTATLLEIDSYKTDSVNYVLANFPVINDPAALATISSLFQIPIDLLTYGIETRTTPTFTSPISLANGFTHARSLLLSNLNFIADETNGYIAINHPTLAYSADKCKRDVIYMVESVCYDLTYGGNSASVFAGLQYWQNATRQIASSEVSATQEAITFISNLATLVTQNQTPSTLYSATSQYKNLSWTDGSLAANKISSSFTAIHDIILDSGNAPTVVDVTLTSDYNPDLLAIRDIIINNKTTIASETTAFLDATFTGNFNYNESTCYRDLGFIIDGVAIDVITGGTWQSVFAGKSYYKNTSARAIAIGTQLTETLDAIEFAKSIGLQVLNQTTATRYQTQATQVFDIAKTASTGAKNAFAGGMDIILNVIKGGITAAPAPSFGTGIWNIVINNGGNGYVDQGAPGNVDIIPAKVIVGVNSSAYGNVVKYLPGSSAGVDTIQLRMTKPGFYSVGEQIDIGETVKDLHITIFVESGIYYEDFPIRLPNNTSIKGDEFRRTIVRPLDRPSQSPWRKVFFYRDAIIDAMELGPYNYSTNYATASTARVNGTSNKITITLGTGTAPQSWIGKVFMDNHTPSNKRGRAVIDSVSNNVMNCTVIYPFQSTVTLASGNWNLYDTINYGRFYLTDPLDINSAAKNNKYIDSFLCNDQTRISNMTFQRIGGFAMVLDPEGQIKTKSPYGQVCSSFTQSTNSKTFAGGQFVDGFAGRLFGTITNVTDGGLTVTVQGSTNSGLDVRPPQAPCAFYVQGFRYQINDIVSFDSASRTVVLTLDVGTPYSAGNVGINIEMGGNKSMLANDFAMINDLAYAIVCTNGGASEQVSTFSYYCHTHYWANNGGQIRSLSGSNAHGDYGMRATGYDVTEKPDAVTLATDMVQVAHVYKQGLFINDMTPTDTKKALFVFISGWTYIPYSTSELEIDHTAAGGAISRYEITSVEHTTATINGQNILKLNISSAGSGGTVTTGLTNTLYHGQTVVIRNLQNFKFNNIDNVKPTRPSTALQYIDDLASIYRIISYNLTESSGEVLGSNIAILSADSSFAYYKFVSDTTKLKTVDPDVAIAITGTSGTGSVATLTFADQGSAPYVVGTSVAVSGLTPTGYNGIRVVTGCTSTSVSFASTTTGSMTVAGFVGSRSQGAMTGDIKIAVLDVSVQSIIDQVNKGIFITGWAGRTHRVNSYTTPLAIATGSYISGGLASTTMYVNAVAGSIDAGDVVTGTGFTGGQTVLSVSTIDNVTYMVVLSAVANSQPAGTITFGITRNGYLNIASTAVENIVGNGSGIDALTWRSTAALGTSTTAKAVTFDINWSPSALPVVDAFYKIVDSTNTSFAAYSQAVGSSTTTQVTVADTFGLTIGMVVSSATSGTYIPTSTVIQSVDSPTTFTVTPACWIPAGAVVSSTVVATVSGVTISNSGSGYLTTPTLTFSGGGATVQALAVCTILNGSIDGITVVSPGYGYTSIPTITLSTGSGTATATTATTNLITVNSSGGLLVNQIITFGGTTFGGLVSGTNYYILSSSNNQITVSTSQGGSPVTLTTAAGGGMTWNTPGNAVLTAVLTATATVTTTATSGTTVNQITLAYPSDPGSFTAGTAITATGFTSKTGSGLGPFLVTLNFSSTTAPATNKWYNITGNANPLYNGFYLCTASSATSITLSYAYDPGVYGAGTTVITKSITSATTNSTGINKPFDVNTSATLRLGYPAASAAQITTRISTCRATGHDFLDIGTGGYSTTNYPYQIYGNPSKPATQSQEVYEEGVGRVFYVSTDQNGIFRVGRFFTVDQGTGTVTFSASIALSNLDGLGFKRGVVVSEFSTDSLLTANGTDIVPTQSAIRAFIDKRLGLDYGGSPLATTSLQGPGYMALNGTLAMKSNLNMGSAGIIQNRIINLATPTDTADAANKSYVDARVAMYDQFSELQDVTFSTLASAQIPVYNSTSSKWNNATLTGDVTLAYDGTTLTSAIGSQKITNAMVSNTAAIAQSKLAMTAAGIRANATGITQSNLGLASFDLASFTSTNGWIAIKASSITKAQMATIGDGAVLANFSGVAANPIEVTAGDVVFKGDGIKNASFGSGVAVQTGYAMLVNYDGVNTANNSYGSVGVTTARAANSLVKTGSSGEVDVTFLKIGGYKAFDLSSTTVQFWTPGGSSATPTPFSYMSVVGSSVANTTATFAGTFDITTTGSTLKSTTLSTGASGTSGSIVGNWQVLTSSTLDVTSGTLKSTTLSTGADATSGSIQGNWSLVGASKLQATYADLAEYYEGDTDYEPGTVLVFGGDKEVTTTGMMNDTRSAGVVTTNPAYVMNSEQTGIKVCIALAGRIPCKVIGRVKKGDLLTTSATVGYAMKATNPTLGAIIGKALENKDYGEAGVIQIAVGRA